MIVTLTSLTCWTPPRPSSLAPNIVLLAQHGREENYRYSSKLLRPRAGFGEHRTVAVRCNYASDVGSVQGPCVPCLSCPPRPPHELGDVRRGRLGRSTIDIIASGL